MKRQSPWCHWSHFKLDQSVLRRLRRRRRSDPLQHKESQVPHHRMKRRSPWRHHSHFMPDQSLLRRWLRRRRRSHPLQQMGNQIPHHRMKRRSLWCHRTHFKPDQNLLRRLRRRRWSHLLQQTENQIPHHRSSMTRRFLAFLRSRTECGSCWRSLAIRGICTACCGRASSQRTCKTLPMPERRLGRNRRSHPFQQTESQIPHHRMKRQSPWCHWSHFKLDQSVLRRLRRRRRSDPLQHKESQVPHHRMKRRSPWRDEAAKSVAPPLAFQPPLAFHAGSELAPQDEAAKSVAPPLAFQAGSELAPQATPTGILDRENEVKDRMKRLLECSCESGKLTEVLQDMVNERRAQSESKAEHIENAVVADDLRERMRGLLENACEDGALAQALSGISCFEAEATGTATDSMQKTSTCQPTTSSEPLARATADCAEQFPAVPETTLEAPTAQLPTTPQPPKEAAPGSQRPSMEIKKLYEQIASMRQDNASLHLQVGALAVQMEDLKKDNQNLVSRITNRLPPSPA
eukprot:TRINITY_DN13189_c0_g1_i5.p1 TRINITY_DN13189_c0_g1~~TRINITY_DN13189_c0_g1_i5.p1  ORF type:complete len:518 (-),score=58.95 TRINITY_DN13189_c0_g1_i5:71-1624(-)